MSSSIDKRRKEACKYKLFAVVVHRGYDLFGGHYYSYVRGLNNGWYQANDEYVSPVQLSKILKESAYILLYQRLDLDKVAEKSSASPAADAPLAKNKAEAQKVAKTMLSEVFGTKGKSASTHSENNAKIRPAPEPSPTEEKGSSTDEEMKSDVESEAEAEEYERRKSPRLLSPTNKFRKMKRIAECVRREKRMKYEVEATSKKLSQGIQALRQVLGNNPEIAGWLDKVEECTTSPKIGLSGQMKDEKRETRKKNPLDAEYDKGKTKKIKAKQFMKEEERSRERTEGLKHILDFLQKSKGLMINDE